METFLVSAVAAVLLIRGYLRLAGYPQIGGSGLHIAHVVWGGLLLLVSVTVLLSFVSRLAREIAAILGGLGFGTFVDEVGKFLTQQNDYFFRPAIAIIYVVFVLLYIAGKVLTKARRLSQRECLAQVMEIANHGVHDGLYPQDLDHALSLLARCDSMDPMVQNLKTMLADMDVATKNEPGILTRLRGVPRFLYRRAIRQPWFVRAVVGLFLLQAVTTLAENVARVRWSLGLVLWLAGGLLVAWCAAFFRKGQGLRVTIVMAAGFIGVAFLTTWAAVMEVRQGPWSYVEVGSILFPSVSSALVVIGIGLLPHSRLAAYQMFQRAILITILLTQVYAFYEHQLIALSGLLINILILLALRYMINQEQDRAAETVRVLTMR